AHRLPFGASSATAIAWMPTGGAFIAVLVVAGPSSHHFLGIGLHGVEELPRSPAAQHRRGAGMMGDHHAAVGAHLVGESVRCAHGSTVVGAEPECPPFGWRPAWRTLLGRCLVGCPPS